VQGAGLTNAMATAVAASSSAEPDAVALFTELPGVPASVRAARLFVADALGNCPRADDLVLAASELSSNAVLWSASSGAVCRYIVRVRRMRRWVRIDVIDVGRPAIPPVGQGNGHGLLWVEAVTDRSGYTLDDRGRRTSWCECTWP